MSLRRIQGTLLLVLGLSALTPLRADALADLKGKLAKLKGSEPLRVSVERENWSRNGDEKKPVVTQGKATAWVEESPQGLKLFWSRDQIQQAAQEAKAKDADPEKTTPTRDVMSSLNTLGFEDYFNSAESVLQDLDQATLIEDKSDTLDGKPARLLSFKVEPRMGQRERKYIKELEATAKVWIDAEGFPVAAQKSIKVKGRAFVVISFKSEQKDEFRFTRIGNRLVTIRHQHESSGSGGGESGQTKQTTTLKYN